MSGSMSNVFRFLKVPITFKELEQIYLIVASFHLLDLIKCYIKMTRK